MMLFFKTFNIKILDIMYHSFFKVIILVYLLYEILKVICQVLNSKFQITDKYLMVVDLQGVIGKGNVGDWVIYLTDPAIHCDDAIRFGSMNLGRYGFDIFFSKHKCNRFCEALNTTKDEYLIASTGTNPVTRSEPGKEDDNESCVIS